MKRFLCLRPPQGLDEDHFFSAYEPGPSAKSLSELCGAAGQYPLGDLARFIEWLSSKEDAPYLWGGRGDRFWRTCAPTPYEGWDSWGLVACALVAAGGRDLRNWWTDRAWAELPVVAAPERGDLVFYGSARPSTAQDMEHVAVVIGPGKGLLFTNPDLDDDDVLPGYRTLGARGGNHLTTTLVMAQSQGARVRYRQNHLLRPRLAGFRRLPLNHPQPEVSP